MSNPAQLLRLNRRFAVIGGSVALGLVGAAAAQQPADNRIKNPGGEEAMKEEITQPVGWFAACMPAKGMDMRLDNKVFKSGKASLFVGNDHVYPQATFNNWAQRIEGLKPGETFVLSGWMKADRAETASMCVQVWDEGGKNLVAFATTEPITGTRDWVLLKTDPITIPVSAKVAIIRAGVGGKGKAWFDDLSLRPENAPARPPAPADRGANLLVNGGGEDADEKAKDDPAHWFKAQVPAMGLEMKRVTDGARIGKAALFIGNTHAYDQAVSNNWAQSVTYDLAGRTVRVSGWVKTQDAQNVNICVQGWTDLANMSSFGSTEVIKGTHDWQRVQSKPVRMSPGTTAVTVRAVLTGTGKVWFDELTLEIVDDEPVE